MKWYRKIDDRYGDAMFQVGNIYAAGSVVPKDDVKAAEYWQHAANFHHPGAQFRCGTIFANGVGVPKDEIRAYVYFTVAASQDFEGASKARDGLEKRMNEEQIDEGRRRSVESIRLTGKRQ